MSNREDLTIKVFDYSYSEWSGTLPAFIAEMQRYLMAIPSEYRDATMVTVEYESDPYDSGGNLKFEASYIRPETDAEMNAREAEAEANRLRYQERQIAQELATLAALQAKYQRPQ